MTGRGRENLLATPAFYGPDRKGTATVVGLAAFPIGSRVRIVNEDMEGRGMAGHTVMLGTKPRTGSVLARIPAPTADARWS
jgi:hypothetical protein